MSKFHVHSLSTKHYGRTVTWAIFLSIVIVFVSAYLGRAAHNFKAALTEKPDVAIYLLLPDEHLGNTTLLNTNEDDTVRAYLAETARGPALIKMHKNKQWVVDTIDWLHEDPSTGSGSPTTETPAPR